MAEVSSFYSWPW